ncbi:MAG: peptide chain release factor N(5)-glutamine methyltransferase, partial [Fibrobacteria bacterium]|nr:peptide chain release factor N(5)-glutamine methyltransferase [Fibrobacteria bacterium]
MQPVLLDILNKTTEYFRQKGVPNFRLDAQLLLSHVLKMDRINLYLNYDRPLTVNELNDLRPLVKRRASREPLQHIVGETAFRELQLLTDGRALVPRKETELILEEVFKAVSDMQNNSHAEASLSVLDIGTGSGAIFLSLLKEIPGITVFGVENSREAVDLTIENAEFNHLEYPPENLCLGNLFEPFPDDKSWD